MKRIIVDRNDAVIGSKVSKDINFPDEIYRVSALWLWNSKGEVLIAQRSLDNSNGAGQWGPSVAGTVEEGETYEENIRKETEEEIGLTNVEFTFVQKDFFEGDRNYFCQVYKAIADKSANDFLIQADEVNAVKWIYPNDLREDVKRHPESYISSMETCLDSIK